MKLATTRRRDHGGALLITTVMIFVTVALIGLLLTAPEAQYSRVNASVTRERALQAAESGVSDGLAWLQANASGAMTWMTIPQATPSAWVSGTLTSPQTGYAGATNPAAVGVSGALISAASLSRSGTTNFPVFATSNFLNFGDPQAGRGQYAWVVSGLGNGYFQIDAEGHIANIGNTVVVSRIRVIANIPIPSTSTLAPTMILPQNRASPPPFGTAPATIANNAPGFTMNGADNATGLTVNNGLVLANPTQFGTGNLSVNGASPAINTAPSAATLAFVDQIVNTAATLAALPAAQQPANFYNGQVSTTGAFSGSIAPKMASGTVTYVSIAPGATTVPNLATYTGAPGSTGGIFIIDVGDNATFGSTGLFDWHGNHFYQGTVIIYQRGRINLTANTFPIADSNGIGSAKPNGLFQYNSLYIQNALNVLNLKPTPKVSSSVVLQ